MTNPSHASSLISAFATAQRKLSALKGFPGLGYAHPKSFPVISLGHITYLIMEVNIHHIRRPRDDAGQVLPQEPCYNAAC